MYLRSPAARLGTVALFSLAASSCGQGSQQTSAAARAPRDLAGIIAPLLETSKIPALGAAVVSADGLEAIGAVGLRSWADTQQVSVDDQWHIGSCTKAMTATLAARLVDRGVLNWETTIGAVFGSTIDPAWKDVPIVWLLSHRSGAPLNFSDALWREMAARGGSPREQRRFFVEQGLRTAPTNTPNTVTVYSNSGLLVAGVMMEMLTDSPWEDLMQREVFEPLGMTRTGFGAPGTPGALDQPLGHRRGADGWRPVALGPNADNPAATGPAGSVHTTLADWARFVAAHLRGENGDERFLSTASWQRLHAAGGKDWTYSPGWVVTEQDWAGGKMLRHIGSNSFWIAEATLAPRKGFAVLLVTNVADDAVETPFKELLAVLVADQASREASAPRLPPPTRSRARDTD
ncbi:MAG: beta-lactamase family protein [Gemmatimonadaceae bacterium]|nr:beta-lactamase family protein [Gemmatimonadaceae bacterium]MCW5826862.1 beta-lactamase family protein [Gemmatimonadaceae bacterium]